MWNVVWQEVLGPDYLLSLPCLDLIASEAMNEDDVCLYRLCPGDNDVHLGARLSGTKVVLSWHAGCR